MITSVRVTSLAPEEILVWSHDGAVWLMVGTETVELTADEARDLALALVDTGLSLTAPQEKNPPGATGGC